jgi:hypothetical protein
VVQDYLYELEKKIAKQQTRVDELRRNKGLNEDKIKKSQDQARKLNIAAEAKENHDIGEREVKMRAIQRDQNYKYDKAVKALDKFNDASAQTENNVHQKLV